MSCLDALDAGLLSPLQPHSSGAASFLPCERDRDVSRMCCRCLQVCDAPKRQAREGNPILFAPPAAVSEDASSSSVRKALKSSGGGVEKAGDKAKSTETVGSWNHVGDVAGRDCIIIDDIIDTGEKAQATAQDLKAGGARRIFMFATHGVLSKGSVDRINNSPIQEVGEERVSRAVQKKLSLCMRVHVHFLLSPLGLALVGNGTVGCAQEALGLLLLCARPHCLISSIDRGWELVGKTRKEVWNQHSPGLRAGPSNQGLREDGPWRLRGHVCLCWAFLMWGSTWLGKTRKGVYRSVRAERKGRVSTGRTSIPVSHGCRVSSRTARAVACRLFQGEFVHRKCHCLFVSSVLR